MTKEKLETALWIPQKVRNNEKCYICSKDATIIWYGHALCDEHDNPKCSICGETAIMPESDKCWKHYKTR